MPPKGIFKGQVFALSGRLSQAQKEYEELIKKHGGEVASSLTTAVTFLVSTADDVKACSQKVATAQGRGTPIVQEGFVGACIAAKKLLEPTFFQIKEKAVKKRKAKSKAAAAAGAAGSSGDAGAEPPAKRAKVTTTVAATSSTAVVIAKSGLADKAAVLHEEVSKGFIKASLCWDVQLVLNDPVTGKDRYYNMQLLTGAADDGTANFWAAQHFGRTGLDGRVHVDGPYEDLDAAKKVFRKKYRQKTGNVWGQLGTTFIESVGKYKLLAREEEKAKMLKDGHWQYYVHKAIDGKEVGWYDYDEEAGANLEKYWKVCETNEGLEVRFVQTSHFKYEINFTEMIQTNVKTGTRRVIRRVEEGEAPSAEPPAKIPAPVPGKKIEDDKSDDEDEDEADEDDVEEEEEEEEEEEDGVLPEKETAAPAEAAAVAVAQPEAPKGGRMAPPPKAEKADDPADADTLAMADTLPFGSRGI